MKPKTRFFMLCAVVAFCSTGCKDNKFVEIEHALVLSSGSVKRFYCESALVDPRNVDVWLPQDYTHTKKYSVIYMHDGQMLFDAGDSWNAMEWGVDETMTKLVSEGLMADAIVVGVWNNPYERHLEYFPQKAAEYIPASYAEPFYSIYNDELLADNYLKFIVKELKPFIDRTFSTLRGKDNTFIAGSSMGGLISSYALCEYPHVFGGAACLSTHWIGTFEYNMAVPDAICTYLERNLPEPETHRVYFDYGTVGLDSYYPEFQLQVDEIMKNRGYDAENWLTLRFDGDDHSERYWAARLDKPFVFLLGDR